MKINYEISFDLRYLIFEFIINLIENIQDPLYHGLITNKHNKIHKNRPILKLVINRLS